MSSWLSEQVASLYEEDILNLVVRYIMCLTILAAMLKDKEAYVESENKYGF